MRQAVYISTARDLEPGDIDNILETSRRNNAALAITGFLYFDGVRFLQALEGGAADVEATLARIRDDGRHRSLIVLSDRTVERREFGEWAMASRSTAESGDEMLVRVRDLVAGASPSVRATFSHFAELRAR